MPGSLSGGGVGVSRFTDEPEEIKVQRKDDGGDTGRRGGDASPPEFQGGNITDEEGDWQKDRSRGFSRERPAEIPGNFIVGAMLSDICGPGHAAGELAS